MSSRVAPPRIARFTLVLGEEGLASAFRLPTLTSIVTVALTVYQPLASHRLVAYATASSVDIPHFIVAGYSKSLDFPDLAARSLDIVGIRWVTIPFFTDSQSVVLPSDS